MKAAFHRYTHQHMTKGRFLFVVVGFTVIWGARAPAFPVTGGFVRMTDLIADAAGENGPCASRWNHGGATIHSSSFAVWQVYDTNAYLKYKTNIDSLTALFDRAVPKVENYLGVSTKLPVRVCIDSGGCCSGMAAPDWVAFTIENFNSNTTGTFPNCDGFNGPAWTRGVIIGEFVNHAQAVGSSGCPPRDWWVDGVWYFPSMVVVNVLRDLFDSTAARYWERHSGANCIDMVTYPLYNAFKNLRLRRGWPAYQTMFKAIRDDSISFCRQKEDRSFFFPNPSALLTNYTLAYLSLGAKENVAEAFRVAGADSVDSAVVNRILSARSSLRNCPNQAGGPAAWQAYRDGKYQAVTVCSPYVASGPGNAGIIAGKKVPATGVISVIDISGRVVREHRFGQGPRDQAAPAAWNGKNWRGIPDKTGVYFLRISTGNQNIFKKLVTVK
jgi:hypothetical protein